MATLLSTPHPLILPLHHHHHHRTRPLSRTRTRHRRRPLICLASSPSSTPNGGGPFPWERFFVSVSRTSERLARRLGEEVKKETGIDIEEVWRKVRGESGEGVEWVRGEVVPEFVKWNKWEYWKDIRSWEPKRIGALLLCTIIFAASCWKIHGAIYTYRSNLARKELTEAYMETLIPEPTPANVRHMKKGIWRKSIPKGLKMKKFIEGPDGTLVHDSSYVGEDAWDDNLDVPSKNSKHIIQSSDGLTVEKKKATTEEPDLAAPGQEAKSTWRERLHAWEAILHKEKVAEHLDSLKSRYAVEFDMKEVEDSLRKDLLEKASAAHGGRALWISKRWWRYRPKLPYTYLLQKLDSCEVAAVVLTEDMKRLYVTMKEGFPLEYIVDIPLDPYLFEAISNAGAEVDLLQRRQIHYFFRAAIALLPGILILCLIRQSLILVFITTKRYLAKFYTQLYDMVHIENLILPEGEPGGTKTISEEVILGGDIWDLLDELMIYMEDPMKYYDRSVSFVRGVLLCGPPGTGKTMLARTLAKESGLPFVFASAAEFTEEDGVRKIYKLFSDARRNAPSFVFVDEIDAIAGKNAMKDAFRRSSLKTLLAQLDGEKEDTGFDRYSPRQAVIFICATNRPSELDLELVRPGRIDRRVYLGLPNAEQRVKIFGLHSADKLAEDVDFEKVVFRTVGYSGADIRNLVNESRLMAIRNGHRMITQQDIIDVLDKELLEGMQMLLTNEEQQMCELNVPSEIRRLLAVHEAGHILLAHLFPTFDNHAFSQLLPGGKETAISVFYPREEALNRGYTTVGYMMMQMVVAHGGRCSEQLVFGDDITDGGNDDLLKLTQIAREMVIRPRNDRLGAAVLTKRIAGLNQSLNVDGKPSIKYKWDDPYVIRSKMSYEVSELFVREMTRYIEETEELAMKGLKDNRHILDVIALKLFEKFRITGLEVEEIMKGLSPIMFEDFTVSYKIDFDQEGEGAPSKIEGQSSGFRRYNGRPAPRELDVYPAPLHRC
ncbi:hypothetical protein Droror1_Dr00016998 [Drosera rotundifolia]